MFGINPTIIRCINWHIWTQSTEGVMIGFAHRKTPPLWARSFFSLFEDVGQIQFISPVGAPDPFAVTDSLDELPAIGTVIVSVELGAVVVLFLVAPDVFLANTFGLTENLTFSYSLTSPS